MSSAVDKSYGVNKPHIWFQNRKWRWRCMKIECRDFNKRAQEFCNEMNYRARLKITKKKHFNPCDIYQKW